MNNYCIGLLIIVLVYICFQNKSIKEGLDVPARHIDKELLDYLKVGKSGHIELSDKQKKILADRDKKETDIHKKIKHRKSFEPEIARQNFTLCKDEGNLHSCDIKYRKPPPIDQRYLNLPPTKLNTSNIYNNLSLCPQAYETNMIKLNKKKTLGQYSGYTENKYIDRTRYIETKKGKEPLPVNPDFFMKGGGVFA
jgi:hypothetical protein